MTEPSTEPSTEPGAKPADDAPKKETDWQVEARKWEQRAKDNKNKVDDLTGRLTALEDTGKSEIQKLTERLDAAEKASAHSARDALVQRIGAEHKLPQSIVGRLKGDTEEELAADAAAMAAIVRQSVRPSGDVDQGNRGPAPKSSPKQDFVALFGRPT